MVSCSRLWLVHVLRLGPHRSRPCYHNPNVDCAGPVGPAPFVMVIGGRYSLPFVYDIQHPNVDCVGRVPLVGADPLVLSSVHTPGSHNYVVDAVVVPVVVLVVEWCPFPGELGYTIYCLCCFLCSVAIGVVPL